ncbi:hypothetical protein K523DRAFT_357979 [Schizophyllum commune Tattone D]|nr:hypothetical protein K523DRAFT_357979 [Schizophyllum commune Tattone D]
MNLMRKRTYECYLWGGQVVSKPRNLPALSPTHARVPDEGTLPIELTITQRPSQVYPYIPMCLRDMDDVKDPILGTLSLLPTAIVGVHGSMQLASDIIVQWIDLELRLMAIRDILLKHSAEGTRPLQYRSCRSPTSCGYRCKFRTRNAVWKAAAHTRDAFAILIGECYYLAIMNPCALDNSGHIHEGTFREMLINSDLDIHPAWVSHFVSVVLRKPVAGVLASIMDFDHCFWLSRLVHVAPVYIWWGSLETTLKVVDGDVRLPTVLRTFVPSAEDVKRLSDGPAHEQQKDAGPPTSQGHFETYDNFIRRRKEWYERTARFVLPSRGHVGIMQAFEWIKDSSGAMRREPVPAHLFHAAMNWYDDTEKMFDHTRSEWDLCWHQYQTKVEMFSTTLGVNHHVSEAAGEDLRLPDRMLTDMESLGLTEEHQHSRTCWTENALVRISVDIEVALGMRYGYRACTGASGPQATQPGERTIRWLVGEGMRAPTPVNPTINMPEDINQLRLFVQTLLIAAKGQEPPEYASLVVDLFCDSSWRAWADDASVPFSVRTVHDQGNFQAYAFSFAQEPLPPYTVATYDPAVALMLQRMAADVDSQEQLAAKALDLGCSILLLRRISEDKESGSDEEEDHVEEADAEDTSEDDEDYDGDPWTTKDTLLNTHVSTEAENSSASHSTRGLDTPPHLQATSRRPQEPVTTPTKPSGHKARNVKKGAIRPLRLGPAPGLGWREYGYKFDHVDVGDYLRCRREYFTVERASRMWRRGGILGRLAQDLYSRKDMLSTVGKSVSSKRPLSIFVLQDGSELGEEMLTEKAENVMIGAFFAANSTVDRFNTKKVSFWPSEAVFGSKGPRCGVWTRDAEEWYVQRREMLFGAGQQGFNATEWPGKLHFASSANKLHQGACALAADFIMKHPDIYRPL